MRVVRSPIAHGRIIAIDTRAAEALAGVVAVWCAADVPDIPPVGFREGRLEKLEPYCQPVLATDRVRYVGDPLAVVFAEDPYVAEDAADLVIVDIEELPVILDAEAAPGEFSPGRDTEAAVVHQGYGDTDAAFRAAHEIVELKLSVKRHSGVPLETRGATRPLRCGSRHARIARRRKNPARHPKSPRAHAEAPAVRDPFVRVPCRRRFRRPRRALPRGRVGLHRRDAARLGR